MIQTGYSRATTATTACAIYCGPVLPKYVDFSERKIASIEVEVCLGGGGCGITLEYSAAKKTLCSKWLLAM